MSERILLVLNVYGRVGWDDVGDFSSLAELLPAEANQPRVLGDSALGAFLFASGGLLGSF